MSYKVFTKKQNIKVHLPLGEYVDNQVIRLKANVQLNYYSYLFIILLSKVFYELKI